MGLNWTLQADGTGVKCKPIHICWWSWWSWGKTERRRRWCWCSSVSNSNWSSPQRFLYSGIERLRVFGGNFNIVGFFIRGGKLRVLPPAPTVAISGTDIDDVPGINWLLIGMNWFRAIPVVVLLELELADVAESGELTCKFNKLLESNCKLKRSCNHRSSERVKWLVWAPASLSFFVTPPVAATVSKSVVAVVAMVILPWSMVVPSEKLPVASFLVAKRRRCCCCAATTSDPIAFFFFSLIQYRAEASNNNPYSVSKCEGLKALYGLNCLPETKEERFLHEKEGESWTLMLLLEMGCWFCWNCVGGGYTMLLPLLPGNIGGLWMLLTWKTNPFCFGFSRPDLCSNTWASPLYSCRIRLGLTGTIYWPPMIYPSIHPHKISTELNLESSDQEMFTQYGYHW